MIIDDEIYANLWHAINRMIKGRSKNMKDSASEAGNDCIESIKRLTESILSDDEIDEFSDDVATRMFEWGSFDIGSDEDGLLCFNFDSGHIGDEKVALYQLKDDIDINDVARTVHESYIEQIMSILRNSLEYLEECMSVLNEENKAIEGNNGQG